MFKLGMYQELIVSSIKNSGFYLKDPLSDVDVEVLLPGAQAPEGIQVGDLINVFVYRDTEDRLITTTKVPKVTLNKIASLKVKKITEIGAFLGWGLDRDLFLPHSEQITTIKEGDLVLIRMYLDKTERLAATMKIQKEFKEDCPYTVGEMHEATIYRINPTLGLFVAVEDEYDGLVLKQDVISRHKAGEKLQLRIARIREDGKLIMSFNKAAFLQKDDDADAIFAKLTESEGFLPYSDYTDADVIRSVFLMSKKSFKRALGKLYKEKLITIEDNGIKLVEKDQ